MKSRQLFIGLTLGLASLTGLSASARAWPSGPSAQEAARLMIAPPTDWIAHYLPDDRYKVVGGVWKVVSTDLDTYYHRPNCPNIQRQSADNVIGFSSAKDAEDSGYRPDPMCSPNVDFSYGVVGTGAVSPLKPGQVLLGDGSSRVLLPKGWKHVVGAPMQIRGTTIYQDTFFSPANQRVEINTVTVPPQVAAQLAPMYSQKNWEKMRAEYKKNRAIVRNNMTVGNTGFNSLMQMADKIFDSDAKAWSSNGITGLRFIAPKGGFGAGITGSASGRSGNRFFHITDFTTGKSGSSVLFNSLAPR